MSHVTGQDPDCECDDMIFNLSAVAALSLLPAIPGAGPAAGEQSATALASGGLSVHLEVDRRTGLCELVGAADGGVGEVIRIVALDRRVTNGSTSPLALRGARAAGWARVGWDGRFRVPVPSSAFGRVGTLAAVRRTAGGGVAAFATSLPPVNPADPLPEPPRAGAVLVTEFMKDPAAVSDVRGEWVELYNDSQRTLDLDGWTLRDLGSNRTVLSAPAGALVVAPGEFLVVGRSGDPAQNGGVDVDATYSGFTLGNGADQIVLDAPGGHEIDRVEYGDGPVWPDEPGRSVSLSPRAWGTPGAALPGSWCPGSSPMSGGDQGTPGAANDTCGG